MIVYEVTSLGHIGIFAQTGSGKGVWGQALAGMHYNAGFKVIDWDVSRQENTLYSFPNKDPSMVDRIRKCNRKPQGFPCEVLFPLTSKDGLIGEKYPENWRPFKIDFAELTSREIVLMLENATPQSINAIDSILFNNNQKPKEEQIKSLSELIDIFFDLQNKLKFLAKETTDVETGKTYIKPVAIHTSTLSSLQRETMALFEKGIFSDKTETITREIYSKALNAHLENTISSLKTLEKSSFIGTKEDSICLDVNNIMNDQKTITSINLFSCKSFREKALCFSWFWRKALELRKTKSKKPTGKYPPILFRCAEAHSFAPSSGIAMPGSEHSTKIMQEIATEGRDAEIKLLLDTQGSRQLNSFVTNQLSVFYLGRMDKTNIDYFHEKVTSIPRHWETKDKIQKQQIGIFTKIWNNSLLYCYPMFVCPSLNRSKEAGQNIKDIYREQKNYLGNKFGWYTLVYEPKTKIDFKLISAKKKNELFEEIQEETKKPSKRTNYEIIMNYIRNQFVVERVEQISLSKIVFDTGVSLPAVTNVIVKEPGREEIDVMGVSYIKISNRRFLKRVTDAEKQFRKEQEEEDFNLKMHLKSKERKIRRRII